MNQRILAAAGTSLLLLYFLACGGTTPNPPGAPPPGLQTNVNQLTTADVQAVAQAAAASVNVPVAVAVTNRQGNILAVYVKPGTPATSIGNFSQAVNTEELAVGLARTASFFSNDQAPLSSRTVRYISGVHFPPGITNVPNADLYGIENTNRGCFLTSNYLPGQALPQSRSIDGSTTGTGIVTGKADVFDSDPNAANGGGVPIFKNGHLAGGVGVAGSTNDVNEYAAFNGIAGTGLVPNPAPPGVVIIGGIALPFVQNQVAPAGITTGTANGAFVVGPLPSPGPAPDGDLITRRAGTGGLTLDDVNSIVNTAISVANTERAVIRLPSGSPARFAFAVSDLNGDLLAFYRMPDATIFSADVAVAKARNVIYFSSASVDAQDMPGVPPGTAVSNRTISFGSQPFFPPGIDANPPGPFFNLYLYDTAHPCTNGHQPPSQFQNGIVFFPGSTPLYKNGVMVGGFGVSGDGVDQDDFDTAQAAANFLPDPAKRADQIQIDNVRLPYFKFPRNPTLLHENHGSSQ
ncbi:MAG: heme-binding protein [Acidobacteria bacterium]|nr:heme-binding protein [Acidobacteriota bacterium]MBV9146801.1 heme-binding protein [Acidobacteriota bacterium]MBV9435983.1 heme-binding protein [Acidobacteriota bacterium]